MPAKTPQHPQEQLQRRGVFAPTSANNDARTVDLVWSTGAPVKRSDWAGNSFIEELSLAPGAVRLERLNAGAPLLDSHENSSLAAVIGVVERAWIEAGEGRATVRFSDRPDVEPIWRDVQAGILRNISVGYRTHKTERDESGPVPVERAVDWEPFELSLVPIPADAGAQTRSQPIQSHKESDMANTTIDDNNQDRQQPTATERRRVTDIMDACRKAGLDGEFAEKLISDGTPIVEARSAIIDAFHHKMHDGQPRTLGGFVEGQGFGPNANVEGRLVRRLQGEANAISLMQVLEHTTGQRGSMEMLVRGSMATTDFPMLLGSAGFQVLREMYDAAPVGARNITRRRQSSDLRDIDLLGLSEFPAMMKILEGGEFKAGNLTDRGGSYRIEEYGRIVKLTRRALLQDMLDAFGEAMRSHGRAIAALEDDLVIASLESGGTGAKCMEDNKALFHADHANSTTATGLTITSLTEAAAKLRQAREVGNGRRLNLAPRWLLVSAQYEVQAIQLTSEINATAAADVNPFAGGQLALMPLVDANLSGSHAYVLCDPASPAAAIEICTGPAVADVQSQNDFETTSVKTRVLADRGLGVRDHRGVVRIPLS
jgi:phage head maturation protease